MTDGGQSSPRRAEPGDVVSIEALVRDAYGHYVERIGMPPLPMVDDYPRRVAAGQAWVLDGAGALVGLVVLVEATDHLYVDNVAVAPSWQGTGIGRALLDFAQERARALGVPELRLATHELMTENRALYTRLGWVRTGRINREGRHAVTYSKPVP